MMRRFFVQGLLLLCLLASSSAHAFDQPSEVELPPAEDQDDHDVGAVSGLTPAPVIGYDPTLGFILGGAIFFEPPEKRGFAGSLQVMSAVQQRRAKAGLSLAYRKLTPWLSLELWTEFENFQDNYYGVGLATPSTPLFETDPRWLDVSIGPRFHLTQELSLGLRGLYSYYDDQRAADILQQSGTFEGAVDGSAAGARVELAHDTRDSIFSTIRGGKKMLWIEPWALQAGLIQPGTRAGLTMLHFLKLGRDDVILALRGEGAASFGDRSYLTNYRLGGLFRLRGYRSNRFRGHQYLLGSSELRFPIYSFISGAVFGETGYMWVNGGRNDPSDIARSGGFGLRFGLPPDRRVKLRFDVGFAPDQWGIFFAFNEAF